MNIVLKASYQIFDTDPNPDVILAPNPANISQFYQVSGATAQSIAEAIIANAQAKANASGSQATLDQQVLAQLSGS